MSRVGMIRKPRWPLIEWCQTTKEKELIESNHFLLCVENPGYCRVFDVDSGMLYHMTNDSFDTLTDDIA